MRVEGVQGEGVGRAVRSSCTQRACRRRSPPASSGTPPRRTRRRATGQLWTISWCTSTRRVHSSTDSQTGSYTTKWCSPRRSTCAVLPLLTRSGWSSSRPTSSGSATRPSCPGRRRCSGSSRCSTSTRSRTRGGSRGPSADTTSRSPSEYTLLHTTTYYCILHTSTYYLPSRHNYHPYKLLQTTLRLCRLLALSSLLPSSSQICTYFIMFEFMHLSFRPSSPFKPVHHLITQN